MGAWRRYVASLPERTVRASAALAAGAIYETSEVVLPRVVRGSKLYQATVARLLRILVEGVGGVQGVYPAETMPVEELTARKAAARPERPATRTTPTSGSFARPYVGRPSLRRSAACPRLQRG